MWYLEGGPGVLARDALARNLRFPTAQDCGLIWPMDFAAAFPLSLSHRVTQLRVHSDAQPRKRRHFAPPYSDMSRRYSDTLRPVGDTLRARVTLFRPRVTEQGFLLLDSVPSVPSCRESNGRKATARVTARPQRAQLCCAYSEDAPAEAGAQPNPAAVAALTAPLAARMSASTGETRHG